MTDVKQQDRIIEQVSDLPFVRFSQEAMEHEDVKKARNGISDVSDFLSKMNREYLLNSEFFLEIYTVPTKRKIYKDTVPMYCLRQTSKRNSRDSRIVYSAAGIEMIKHRVYFVNQLFRVEAGKALV